MKNTCHEAFRGRLGHQQHAISFFENPKTKAQEEEIRDAHRRSTYSFRPSESYINSDRPRIRRMVGKLLKPGFESLKY